MERKMFVIGDVHGNDDIKTWAGPGPIEHCLEQDGNDSTSFIFLCKDDSGIAPAYMWDEDSSKWIDCNAKAA